MADYYQTFRACVLSTRAYKERDILIKLLTENHGKRMFLIRNIKSPKNALRLVAFPFVRGEFIGHINDSGLSFLNQVNDYQFPKRTVEDIEVNAYASYMSGLADAVVDDNIKSTYLYHLFELGLRRLEDISQSVIVLNIFELQLLPLFGVPINLKQCAICGRMTGVLDYSVKYNGLLCRDHFSHDPRRLHWEPKTTAMIQRLAHANLETLKSVHVSNETIQSIRQAIDQLYEEYVGLHLKSKSFIDQMVHWQEPKTLSDS